MTAVTARASYLALFSHSSPRLLYRSRPWNCIQRIGVSAACARRCGGRSFASLPNPPSNPSPQDPKMHGSKPAAPVTGARPPKKDHPLPDNWTRLSVQDWAPAITLLDQLPMRLPANIKELQILSITIGGPKGLKRELDLIKDSNSCNLQNMIQLNAYYTQVMARARELGIRTQKVPTGATSEPRPNAQKGGAAPSPEETKKSPKATAGGSKKPEGNAPKKDKDKANPDGKKKEDRGLWLELSGLVAVWVLLAYGPSLLPKSLSLSWQDVRKNYVEKGLVERFIVSSSSVVAILHHPENIENPKQEGSYTFTPRVTFSIASRDAFEKNLNDAQDDLDISPSDRIPVEYARDSVIMPFLWQFGPTLLLVALILYARSSAAGRGGDGGIFGMTKSKAKIYSETGVKVRFSDVAGLDDSKVEIMEFVSFLKDPTKFERLGARIPRGAILSGPPGTGKTMLAKATAGECGVPFFSVSGSEFVEVFVGVGPSRVRDLFAMARKNSPSIIFIDEIDAIGRSRQSDSRFGGNSEREATLNQILTEMDGFNTQEKVVVLAGTNRADVLDGALLRPGRFDRHIYIDRPTMKGRKDIFKVHLKKIKTDENIEDLVGKLASMTPGFSGADIANVVNEAALIAARRDADSVTRKHFEDAVDRVVGGLEKKSMVIKPDEKRIVAYHEAGHAICGWFMKECDPLVKVSIIPRGQAALGYAQYLPASDSYLLSAAQLMDRMAMALGGRVSEEIHFDSVTTGASDDFQKVSKMARRMVTEWGMSKKVGPIHFDNDSQQFHKPFAEMTAQTIDQEVQRIVEEAYDRCRTLLQSRKSEIAIVADELLKKEVLTREDMFRLLGKRPWATPEEFEKYFDGSGGSGESSAPPPFPTDASDLPDAPPLLPESTLREAPLHSDEGH